MDASPLTLQARPVTFEPKVASIYRAIFNDDGNPERNEGFWHELFLLNPDIESLRSTLSALSTDDLLHLQGHSQQLFLHAIRYIGSGAPPSDEAALDTLTVFLGVILSKRYTNPSSDIINVIAGLDDADTVFTDFVGVLDDTIRNGRTLRLRQKAVRTAMALVSGAYQTGLVSYFTHRDLFPALMKLVDEAENDTDIVEPLLLLGLLANYEKFEFQNPYSLRLGDFVNENIIQKLLRNLATGFRRIRDEYISVRDDVPEGWTIGSTLSYIGLGILAPRKKTGAGPATEEEARSLFAALPGPNAAILLTTYDFVYANKLFGSFFVTLGGGSKEGTLPFSAFLSLTSYLLQHAHRSERATLYTHLNLFTLQLIIEDPVLVKHTCSEESKTYVRLCRQRQPYLPVVQGETTLAAAILDMMLDGVNHNLRRRLDTVLYSLCLGILLRLISFLCRSRIRLAYHWSEVWGSLLSVIRFLTTYAADLKSTFGIMELIETLVKVIALSLSNGEAFLPDPASYDDLFYKLVETGETLIRFRDAYELTKHTCATSMDILVNVSSHYFNLLQEKDGKPRSNNLSPREVKKIIKDGYDTLSIQSREGLDRWDRYREADHRSILKKVRRCAVDDAGLILSRSVCKPLS